MAKATKKRGDYLIDKTYTEILGSKLPSNGQVLSVFLHHHVTLKKAVKDSANKVWGEVEKFWQKARIPTKRKDHGIEKILLLHREWQSLKKNKFRRNERQMEKEGLFEKKLADLFDVAIENALSVIEKEEDKAFLVAQRQPGRNGSMGSADLVTTKKELTAHKQYLTREARKRKADEEACTSFQTVELASSASEDDDINELASHGQDEEMHLAHARKKTDSDRKSTESCGRPQNIVTPALAAALDRTGLTDRKATYVLTAAAESLGQDPEKLNISRSSIKRQREEHRKSFGEHRVRGFKDTVSGPCIVHWDGKLLPSLLNSTEHVDRLPVLVSSLDDGQSHLLGVPNLLAGTGKQEANSVFQLLMEWGLVESVFGMCFDTTASNTGRFAGACVLLEQKLGKSLLQFACRHHVLELVLTAVFSACYGPSSGPDIQIFKRFKQRWSYIDQSRFISGMCDEEVRPHIEELRNDLIAFATEHLTKPNCRDDYKEFLELSVMFLGGRVFSFKRPGAMHHARWMAKVIYCIKMWLFHDQIENLRTNQLRCLRDVSIFAVTVYMKAWFTAPIASSAPFSDLNLLSTLKNYYHPKISKSAFSKFKSHLWYLSEEMVSLALFDPSVPDEMKKNMMKAMKDNAGEDGCPKRLMNYDKNASLDSLTSANSTKLLEVLQLDIQTLDDEPQSWLVHEGFLQAKTRAANIRVVNDCAERGVALIQEFNSKHTQDEEQLQYLLQVVADHRKQFPDAKKSTLRSLTK